MLVIVIVEVPDVSPLRVSEVGFALRLKSGGGGGDVTVTENWTVRCRVPLVPVESAFQIERVSVCILWGSLLDLCAFLA